MFAFLTPLISAIGGAIGGVGSAAVGAAGTVASGVGTVAGGALNLGGQAIGMTASLPGAAWNLGGQVIGAAGTAAKWISTPANIEALKPAAELLGQGYGVYMTYEQQKAAAAAARKFGGQVTVPYPAGVVGGPQPQGGFQTIVDVKSPIAPSVGDGPRGLAAMDPEVARVAAIGAIGITAYILFV